MRTLGDSGCRLRGWRLRREAAGRVYKQGKYHGKADVRP